MAANLHVNVCYRSWSHYPLPRNGFGQVLSLHIKVNRIAVALRWETAIPGYKIGIEMLDLDAANQRVVKDVLLAPCSTRQAHYLSQRCQGFFAHCLWHSAVGHTCDSMVTRGPTRAIDTAESYYDR